MTSLLEQTRALHEDLEKKQKTLTRQLDKQPRSVRYCRNMRLFARKKHISNDMLCIAPVAMPLRAFTNCAHSNVSHATHSLPQHKEAVVLDHSIQALLESAAQDSNELAQLYDDKDGLRKAEIASITTQTVFTTFYNRLRAIREYHAKFPDTAAATATPLEDADNADADLFAPVPQPTIQFSGEENFGRYLDLHALHERALNLPQFTTRPRDYLSFLQSFHRFDDVPRAQKLQPDYRRYVSELLDYLTAFHARIRPLYPIASLLARISEDFAQRWESGSLPGWSANDADSSSSSSSSSTSSSSTLSTSSTAASSNVDESNPLFCKPCAHLFAKDTVFNAHLSGKKHKKNVEALEALAANSTAAAAASPSSSSSSSSGDMDTSGTAASSSTLNAPARTLTQWREVAALEHRIDLMAVLLRDFAANTVAYIEKKQTKTWEEIEAELLRAEREDEEGEESEEDEDEEDAAAAGYNPLNIPLGWDGKPIPYWLYKLHGLNIEYNCEICGDFSYRGPRAYQRHFQEVQSATRLFFNIISRAVLRAGHSMLSISVCLILSPL